MRVTSLAAAALASAILAGANVNSNVVKADVAPEGTTAKAQSAIDNAKANVESAQRDVDQAQQDVDTAKSNLDKAQDDAKAPDAAYDAQKSKTDAAEKNAADKKTAWDAAKKAKDAAQALVDEANDPAKVKKANDDVTAQEGIVKNDQTEKQTADQKVKDQNTQIGKDNTAVSDKTAAYGKAQKAKTDADKAVSDAEDALKGTGVDEAQNEYTQAEKAEKKAKGAWDGAKGELGNLQGEQKKLNDQLPGLQSESEAASLIAKKLETEYKKKEAEAQAAQEQAQKQEAEVEKLQSRLIGLQGNKSTLKSSNIEKYKKVFLDWFNNSKLSQDEIDFINSEREKNNYISSDADKKIKISDINNLSDDQIQDLSLFAAGLINNLRDQLGWKDISVTKGSVKFIKDVAQKYLSDYKDKNWKDGLVQGPNYEEGNPWHDIAGINNTAKDNGMYYDHNSIDYTPDVQNSNSQYYEQMGSDFYNTPVTTMDQLKNSLYNTIKDMIFPAGNGKTSSSAEKSIEFGHAAGLLGVEVRKTSSTITKFLPLGYKEAEENAKARKSTKIYVENGNYKIAQESIKKDIEDSIAAQQKSQMLTHKAAELRAKYMQEQSEGDPSWYQDYQAWIDAKSDALTNKNEANRLDSRVKNSSETIQNHEKNLQAIEREYKETIENLETKVAAPYVAAIPTVFEHANNGKLYGINHIVSINPANVLDHSKFDETVIPPFDSSQAEELNKKIKEEKGKLPGLENTARKLAGEAEDFNRNTLIPAKKAADEAGKRVKRIQDELNLVINPKIEKLSKEVIPSLERKWKQAHQNTEIAYTKLQNLTADNKTKANKYAAALKSQKEAKNNLKLAKDNLDTATQVLKEDQTKLKTLQQDAEQKAQDLQDAQNKLDKLKQHVEDLKNASQILAKADANEKKAHADYDVAKKAADEAAQELAKLAPAKKAADAKVAAAQAAYDEALARLREAEDRLAAAKRALADLEAAQERVDTSKLDNHKSSEKTANTKLNEASTKNTKKRVVLTHNAFVYTKSGKAIRSGLHIKFIRRGKTLKTLKVVTINGKKFYQIGRNQYVKVANTRIKTHAVHIKARIKGLKKVKAYDRRGKFNKHYVRSKRSYSFNEKAVINGKTYYKIAGTNDWILANKLALKK